MVELGVQLALLFLCSFARGDVSRDLRCADDFAAEFRKGDTLMETSTKLPSLRCLTVS